MARIELAVLFFGAVLLVVTLLGSQRTFQSRVYETALQSLEARVATLEGHPGAAAARRGRSSARGLVLTGDAGRDHAALTVADAGKRALDENFPGLVERDPLEPSAPPGDASEDEASAPGGEAQGGDDAAAREAAARPVAPGARRVFIDLGANCGNSYMRLRRKKVLEGKWEVYLWEANPQMIKFYLTDLAKRDKQVHVVPLAAWTENKKMKFYLTKGQENITDIRQFKAHKCSARGRHQPAGASSLFSGAGAGDDKRRKSAHRPGQEVTVDAVDFAAWMRDLNLKPNDRVVLKVDIEGAEVPLMRKFLKSPPLPCLVDVYYVEWHSWMIADEKEKVETEAFERGFLGNVEKLCGRMPAFGSWH